MKSLAVLMLATKIEISWLGSGDVHLVIRTPDPIYLSSRSNVLYSFDIHDSLLDIRDSGSTGMKLAPMAP